MTRLRGVIALTAVVLTGVGCSGDDSPAITTSTVANSPSSTSPVAVPGNAIVLAARQEIADRFGYALEEVEVRLVEAVVWPDTALGCPAHDQEYEDRPIAGYRLVLGVGQLEYHFHGANDGSAPRRCQFLD